MALKGTEVTGEIDLAEKEGHACMVDADYGPFSLVRFWRGLPART